LCNKFIQLFGGKLRSCSACVLLIAAKDGFAFTLDASSPSSPHSAEFHVSRGANNAGLSTKTGVVPHADGVNAVLDVAAVLDAIVEWRDGLGHEPRDAASRRWSRLTSSGLARSSLCPGKGACLS
jgi:hypothetical protein